MGGLHPAALVGDSKILHIQALVQPEREFGGISGLYIFGYGHKDIQRPVGEEVGISLLSRQLLPKRGVVLMQTIAGNKRGRLCTVAQKHCKRH